MKLECGMYVRTYKGINKVIKIDEHRGQLYYKFKKPFEVEFLGEDIIKSSFNLIDLIEVGDYVNGKLTIAIQDNPKVIFNEQSYSDGKYAFTNEEIKEVLTHEQYEANCYKVVE